MIVIAIIGIVAGAIYPQTIAYYARGRDVARLSDIKNLSANFQNYSRTNNTYPSNVNTVGTTSYCVSDMRTWTNAIVLKDKQFTQLGGTGTLRSDPIATNPSIGTNPLLGCLKVGSYFYARRQKETFYSVVAARMELQATGANYSYVDKLGQDVYVDDMIQARPLDPNLDDLDKIFLVITN